MTDPKTPAESLRKMADAVQERAHSSERACMSLSDNDAPEFVVAMARGEADATRRIEAMLRTEAERLDALPPPELSKEDIETVGAAVHNASVTTNLPDSSPEYLAAVGANFIDELAETLAVVRVKP